jgi:hypothetical protein
MISAALRIYRRSLSASEQSSADGLLVLDMIVAALNARTTLRGRRSCHAEEQRIATDIARYP